MPSNPPHKNEPNPDVYLNKELKAEQKIDTANSSTKSLSKPPESGHPQPKKPDDFGTGSKTTLESHQTYGEDFFYDALVFWVRAWLGTAIGGGLFGMGIGLFGLPMGEIGFVFIGAFMGFLLAAFIAIPVHLIIATLAWAFWLSKYRHTIASLAGGLTGFVATGPALFNRGPVLLEISFTILMAVGLGAFGSIFAVRKLPYPKKENERWQFSMRDLFKRMTALAILTFVLNFLIRAIFTPLVIHLD